MICENLDKCCCPESKSPLGKKSKFSYFIILASLLFVLLHYGTILFEPFLYHDVAMCLTTGDMVLDGDRPFVEIIDTNPPFVIYLGIIPALVARLFCIDLALSGYLFFVLLEILFIFLIIWLVKKIKLISSTKDICLLSVFIIWGSTWTWYFSSLGQREHVIPMILVLFTLYRYGRHAKVYFSRFQILAFVFSASCAFSMKPHYILPVFLVEVFYFLKFRRGELKKSKYLLPDFPLFVFFGAIYLGHFLVIPGMSDFYTYWLGFIRKSYSSYDVGVVQIAKFLYDSFREFWAFALINIAIVILFFKEKRETLILSVSFSLVALGCFAVYFIQSKEWVYQVVPFIICFFIAIFFLTKAMLDHLPENYGDFIRFLLPLILILFWFYPSHFFVDGKLKHILEFPSDNLTTAIKTLTKADERVMFLNPRVAVTFPTLTYANRKQASRFIYCFPFALIFQDSKDFIVPEKYIEDERKCYQALVQDLKEKKPKLIIISKHKHLPRVAAYFNMYEYLEKRGFLKEMVDDYKEIASGKALSMYLRKDAKINLQ